MFGVLQWAWGIGVFGALGARCTLHVLVLACGPGANDVHSVTGCARSVRQEPNLGNILPLMHRCIYRPSLTLEIPAALCLPATYGLLAASAPT